jgi:hypothetical protein
MKPLSMAMFSLTFVIFFVALISVPPISYVAWALNLAFIAITGVHPLVGFSLFIIEAMIITILIFRGIK